jgi:protocatechuate 3,4-dioxygenase beta subunit
MTGQRATADIAGGAGATPAGTEQYAYEAWEEVTRNEPNLSSLAAPLTLSILTGPGPALSAVLPEDSDLTTNAGTGQEAVGQRIIVTGRVLDEHGEPIPDVLIEIWQANAAGRYNHPLDQRPLPLDPAFIGFGRASTDANGHYWFETIKPGPVPYRGEAMQAPHIVVTVHASGVAYPLVTRMYFADDPRNADDPFLQRVPEGRRHTLLASPERREGQAVYRFDIVLRGEAEELALESKVAMDAAAGGPSGAGKAETVFLALR